jgi:hypothetical protein
MANANFDPPPQDKPRRGASNDTDDTVAEIDTVARTTINTEYDGAQQSVDSVSPPSSAQPSAGTNSNTGSPPPASPVGNGPGASPYDTPGNGPSAARGAADDTDESSPEETDGEPGPDQDQADSSEPAADESGDEAVNRPGEGEDTEGGRESSNNAPEAGGGENASEPSPRQTVAPADDDSVYDTPGNQPSEGAPKAASDDNRAGRSTAEGPKDSLAKKEAAADNFNYSGQKAHHNQVGGGYNPNPPKNRLQSPRSWMFNKRRKALGGGIIGTIIGLFLFGYASGPLQFIHIAQLLEQAHFSSLQSQTDDRGLRLARDIRYAKMGQIEKVRLGRIGNHFADKIEASFNKAGIESSYTDTFGFRDGLIIDPEKLPAGSAFGDLKDKSPAEIKSYFKANFNVDAQTSVKGKALPGKSIFVDTSNLSYLQNRSVTKAAVATTGISKKYSALSARIMGTRAGVTWHPIKSLDNTILKTVEDRYTKWRATQADELNNGVAPDVTKQDKSQNPDSSKDANQTSAEAAHAASDAVDAAIHEGDAAAADLKSGSTTAEPKLTSSIQDKFTGSKTVGATALVGILCTVKALGENIDNIKQDQVVLPLIRYAVQFIALGAQVMSGQGVDMEQLSFFSKALQGKDSTNATTSWSQAQPFQAQAGQAQTGPGPSDTLNSIGKGNPFSELSSGAVGSAMGAVCGKVGSAIQTVIGFLGGPISFAVQTVVAHVALPPLINKITHWLSHDPANIFAVGRDAGYNMMYGARLAANAQATSAGGRPLSTPEEVALSTAENTDYQKNFAYKNIAYKLFSPYDRGSSLSQLIDHSGTTATQNLAKMGSFILNYHNLFGSLSKLFSPSTHAAALTTYDYGFPMTGFSAAEMSNPKVANPYQNADEVVNTILPAHSDYIDRAKKCFGVIIDSETFDITSWQGGIPEYKSDSLLDGSCSDNSIEWLQTRFYIFDTQTAQSAACYHGDASDDIAAQACADIGFGASVDSTQSSTPTTSGTPVTDAGFTMIKLSPPLATPGGKITPKGITLHWWGDSTHGQNISTLESALRGNSTCGAGGCSVQVGITADGKVYQMTDDLLDLTYHAIGGNQTTIGIEIGGTAADFGVSGITKYPQKFNAVVSTVKYLVNKYKIPLDGPVVCGDVVGVHPHSAYNNCPGAVSKDDIDATYFNAVMKAVRQ